MSTSYERKDRVLSVREREHFRREIKDRERMLQGHIVIPSVSGSGPEGMNERRMGRIESYLDRNISEDPNMLKGQIARMKRVLDKGSPRDLSRRERQQLEKQAREDEEYFKKRMVNKRTYFQKSVFKDGTPNPDFDRAQKAVTDREIANQEFQKRANRYSNNMRELVPEDPEAPNIEKFRPK